MWFQDKARIGQQNGITRVWRKRHKATCCSTTGVYLRVFVGSCLSDSGPSSCVGHASCQQRGDELASPRNLWADSPGPTQGRRSRPSALAHDDETPVVFESIVALLPPASPELNPQERVWLKLRQDYLSNLAFKDSEDIVEKSCMAWNSFVSQKHAVTNLCHQSWASLQV